MDPVIAAVATIVLSVAAMAASPMLGLSVLAAGGAYAVRRTLSQ